MTRIVVDPVELDRFAGLAVEAADDYATRASALRNHEPVAMPPEVAGTITDAIANVAANLDVLATSLYAEALLLRSRAAILDPALRRYLSARTDGQPG